MWEGSFALKIVFEIHDIATSFLRDEFDPFSNISKHMRLKHLPMPRLEQTAAAA